MAADPNDPGVPGPPRTPLPSPPPLPGAALNALRAHGVDAPRLRAVLAALSDGRGRSADDLVRATGVARVLVVALLEQLVEAGEAERAPGGDRVRLVRPDHYAGAAGDALADPVRHLVPARAGAAAEIARAVAEGPSSDLDLDHVTATADTALRRALFLATRFDLADRTVLCVGDHDLTSVALALVEPRARVLVADIDERVLAHIDAVAGRLGLDVRTHFADLRLGLPAGLRGQADVVFTDPPYTADGVELFVRRGLEGMTDPRRGRVLVAYGVSETTPRLAAATQARLLRLDLVLEAMWPDFHRYEGAESIGAASDLYVLRPLSRTAPPPAESGARVYSQGVNAKEARGSLTEERAAAALERAAADSGGRPVPVGAWPAAVLPDAGRVRLSTWMEAQVPLSGPPVVDLTGGWERIAARAALACPEAGGYLLVPSSAACVRDERGQSELRAVVEPRFRVRFLRGFGDPSLTAVRLVRAPEAQDPVDRLLAHVQEHARGTLTSVLRAGVVRVAQEGGAPVNKRTARLAVAAAPPWVAGRTLLDLPGHRFARLREAVAAVWEAVERP
ncbi:bis-aminopropyl spermidine synthase family protein [Nocardiopsis changdeensis]|uniref:Bis-aminopropyl spermidine synthase family protein n=1 Tax=Nocardiopsis changdeensis TaxID=2831969 RepID=A0ABX8BIR8_9ACTN|nr:MULTISPECIES: bis-aminopropyl spermidine synthase family protein [Nocardiopsis]QUX21224.1 bis-aminopropyl spermidine synthase family protein [Nocardiopsis changdeensis]QYX37155.1 bis-aminopropyl spermidine synthase family protein [Nocardiopsis sp. MT53]